MDPLRIVRLLSCVALLCCVFLGKHAFSDSPSISREAAIVLSHSIVDALINDRYRDVYEKMEKNFRDAVPYSQLKGILENMYAEYGGKPLEAEFKWDEVGYKLYPSGERKPLRKFWYAVRTLQYEKGTYFLFVEIVPDGDHLASCGVMIVRFADEVPPHLRSTPGQ